MMIVTISVYILIGITVFLLCDHSHDVGVVVGVTWPLVLVVLLLAATVVGFLAFVSFMMSIGRRPDRPYP